MHTLPPADSFARRHIGPSPEDQAAMLAELGFSSLNALIDAVVPSIIRSYRPLALPEAASEEAMLRELDAMMAQNQLFRSYIGMGYHNTLTPAVIRRNILENPGWYTQYTPYQAEIAQGRLEAMLNFQTMIAELTGLPCANASLLDEATAAAEALHMAFSLSRDNNASTTFFVSNRCHPQTIEVLKTRAEPLGVSLMIGDHREDIGAVFGALVQYPATDGELFDYTGFFEKLHQQHALAIVAADPLALVLLKTPAEMNADIAIGSTQRFGVPLGFGGPHAAYMSTRDAYKRSMPGRLVGVSIDSAGNPALRLALQTREQHIRREKATSNICTAQVLLAVIASMYAVYHGPEGLTRIARRIQLQTGMLAAALQKQGYTLTNEQLFDTITVKAGEKAQAILKEAESRKINLRDFKDGRLGISLDETTNPEDVLELAALFGASLSNQASGFSPDLARSAPLLTHPIFNQHRSETELLRYIRKLESRDLSLTHSMISLGSCTMKLNASSEMLPITWPTIGGIHPFAPTSQTKGYQQLFTQLEAWLADITGFAATSLQPNAGSQGEYAGLLVIRAWQKARQQEHRNVCLIPASAHGTNPASAAMAEFQVVVVKCDNKGNIDLGDLRLKAEQHANTLAALMVTYPSTHGVFEETIKEVCAIVHQYGGQVYMDGANMNALVGLVRPGELGADVCHLNLHKTFCIPHGGGGPGMGPICVASHLAPHLPGHPVMATGGSAAISAVSAAPWGSASILPIPWAYIRMMGQELTQATRIAILNANYIAFKLRSAYPTLYTGAGGLVAHECILELRPLKQTSGVEVEDLAKRLMDYGFHAPTVSFPVAGTLMVEPTESESKAELDRFIKAMLQIREEIRKVEAGEWPKNDNPLKGAPHTAAVVTADSWSRSYSRQVAAFPAGWVREHKFWPFTGRVNNVHGDRNLICTCPPIESYE
jgi:glycine dehydrogenase